ncbi:epimerase family protein SDR39U1 [Grus japonensis]|uniref:Epimerase family protein SDR39U1 n=1 Tax=Grus japonensis TaxID=30415 RepID=A0ABC9W8N0_GRUJA
MDVLLTKAEPITGAGGTSVITYLRSSIWERGVSKCERNNSADTKVGAEGGGGGAQGTRAEIPLQPMEKTMVRQAVPLQPKEVHGGADIHLQPTEDPTSEQAPGRTCGPWRGAHAGAGLLAGKVAHGGPTLEQSVPDGLHPVERTHTRAVLGELSPLGGTPCWSSGRA